MAKAKLLTRLIGKLEKKGKTPAQANAIATAVLQRAGDLKKGSTEATPKGKKRGNMTPAQRLKSRNASAKKRK